jgi:hypothetical protein
MVSQSENRFLEFLAHYNELRISQRKAQISQLAADAYEAETKAHATDNAFLDLIKQMKNENNNLS